MIGVDNEEPNVELERTEYVKVGAQHALLRRVVEAAEIDTVVDTRLVVDSATMPSSRAHENNVIGHDEHPGRLQRARTRRCARSSSSRRRTSTAATRTTRPSSTRRCGGRTRRSTAIERDIVEAEASLNEFAEKQPGHGRDASCGSRTCSARTSRPSHIKLFSLPVVPMILGFDPRYQFVHEDDVVHALEHAVKHRRARHLQRGRATACSRSARWPACSASRTRRCCRRGGPGSRRRRCARLGVEIPPEVLEQMRFGRGVDNRRYKAAGFNYTLHEPRDRRRSSASTCACTRSCAARRSRTATSARWRTSCAGART